jgi:hypothetical protein
MSDAYNRLVRISLKKSIFLLWVEKLKEWLTVGPPECQFSLMLSGL